MSKKTFNIVEEEIGYGAGYVMGDWLPSKLEGKLLTLLESIGLPEKQEKAIKSRIREIVWQDFMSHTLFVSADQHNRLRRENRGMGQPPYRATPVGELE